MTPEFDNLSASYEELLKDPIRDRFTGAATQFFHVRKRDLIRDFFRRQGVDTGRLAALDLGCGKGDLLKLLHEDFTRVAGCDPSSGMLQQTGMPLPAEPPPVSARSNARTIETRVQPDPQRIPFEDASFDFVSAVCVYHHVPVHLRAGLTAEVRRVLRPGGWFAIIEHNPYNPVTRLIVSRTPVDADAILLRPAETSRLLRAAGFRIDARDYFLYCPEKLYRAFGGIESALRSVPFGGQYAVFGNAA